MQASMLDQGVWSEVKIGGEHLRLFSEQSTFGVQASVYDMIAKTQETWALPLLKWKKGRWAALSKGLSRVVGNDCAGLTARDG
jgi:hypothetical protein